MTTRQHLESVLDTGVHHAIEDRDLPASLRSDIVHECAYQLTVRGGWFTRAEIQWLTAEHEWLREELAYTENARRDGTCLDCPSALYDGADAHQARYPHHRVTAEPGPAVQVWAGSRRAREQVRQAGNAVTPPAARDLVGVVAESLGVS